MNPEEKREFEQLKLSVQGLEETLGKLQTCATVMKEIVEKYTKTNVDQLVKDRMKDGDNHGQK